MSYIFKLSPAFKETVWGKDNLKKLYGKNAPFENLGESWEASCHPNGLSVIENGIFEGKTLKEVLDGNKNFLGEKVKTDKFPLLFKLIDANDNLSVQVHPDDEMAKTEGDSGKNEMWIVLSAKKGAGIYAGFKKEITRDEFLKYIEKNTLEDILNFIPVKKGDAIYLKAGTVHAIGKGVVIAEIQQSSDITYRIYDYNRLDKDGKKRELHIEKALAAIKYFGREALIMPEILKAGGNTVLTYPSGQSFFSQQVKIKKEYENNTKNASFEIVFIAKGSGRIKCRGNELEIKKGDTLFVPADTGIYKITGEIDIYRFLIDN